MQFEKISEQGLSKREAEKRLKNFGTNAIIKKNKISPIKILLSQFNDFIIWVLIGATIISGVMGEKADAITIIIIVIMNAILGFIQEYKTEKSLEALKELAAPTAKVVRDGSVVVINSEYLVPGDVVIIEGGDRIPADGILYSENGLMVDESLLTGESVPVEKRTVIGKNEIFMGTIVLKGHGRAKVLKTGMKTEMGKIAGMLENIENEKSPLKEKLNHLGKIMVIICIVICGLVTEMGIIRGQDKYQMFLLGVSLAVAAIPEGLPAIVTVVLAIGVSRMLKKNALIRKLPAVETLGCTSIICSDKTGTLTENNMTVKALYYDNHMYTGEIYSNNLLLKKAFTYCNDCLIDFNEKAVNLSATGDPTETALIKALYKNTEDIKKIVILGERVYENPFDSDRKMMSVIIREKHNGVVKDTCYVKGAPERIIERCNYIIVNQQKLLLTDVEKRDILKVIENLSSSALRCIAAAYKENNIERNLSIEKGLTFIGIAGMIDPPRIEAKDAVLKCKMSGITPIMITGDHKNTAYAIGKELEICKEVNQVITGEEINRLSDKELMSKLNNTTVFARVSPDNKLRIVRGFKNKKMVVAMTGDGVNDAPAVKEADIGISMGISGTDVTKEASSMILLDDNFSTIVSAVEEGRVIYKNIRKFIRYLLSCNLGEVLTMFLSSLFYLETPLLPIQILFVNLVTDGLPALSLGVDTPEMDIMMEKPRERNESIFAGGLMEKIIIRGSLIGVCTIMAFITGRYFGMDIETNRTLTLGTLIMSQLIHVFECRSEKHSIFEIKPFTNMYMIAAVGISVFMLVAIIYIPFLQSVFHTVPLNFGKWMIVIFYSGIISFINSLYLLIKVRKK